MPQLSVNQLAQVCRRFGTSLRSGVDVRRIISGEAQRGPVGNRPQFQHLHDRLLTGDTLTEAIVSTNGLFPTFAVEMVDVGEKTGRTDEVFLRLADHYDHIKELRRTFLSGVFWPLIQLGMAILVVALLIWIMGLLPHGEGGKPIDILGFGLIGTEGVIKYFAIVGTGIALLVLVVQALRKSWFGPAPLQIAMQLPFVGNCIHTMALERLCWSLAMALEAGIDAKRSITIALRSTSNSLYLSKIDTVQASITRGEEFHEALRATSIFPDEFLVSLETAEISGTQVNAMEQLSKQYSDKAKMLAKTLTVVSTFVVWITVALIIILMIVRIASFYFGILYGALDELGPR